jgi:pilus assembly protein CpaB
MNRRVVTILVIAFVVAGATAFVVARMLGGIKTAAKPVLTTSVVAANADIKLGAVLNASNLTTMQIAGAPPKGAILKPEDAIGRGVLADIYQGEPIIESRLAAVGSGGGLAATIPQGMRACAVKVDDVVGVAGFVTPGMRVDVLISGIPPGAQGAQTAAEGIQSRTILQNIQVLSAGTEIQKDPEGKAKPVQVVNLLVTPEQAETLTLAGNQQVKIQLVLRNPLDTKTDQVPGTAMTNLFADPNARKPMGTGHVRRAPSDTFTIEVINGDKAGTEKFHSSEGKQ